MQSHTTWNGTRMPPRTKSKPKSTLASATDRKIKALVFGPPGHGKTHFLGTAVFDERTCPIAIFDFEGGVLDVLTGLPGEGTDWVRIPVNTWDEFNEGYERLRVNDEGFKSTAIDSLSETHIFALMNILDDNRTKREERGDNPDLIQQPDYGVGLIQIRRLVRYFRDLPLHTFYTALPKQEVDSREGMVTMVALAGKAAVEIPGLMTVVGYLALSENDEGETQRVMLLQNYAKMRTKVRTPWGVTAPDELENPTVTSLLDALHYE